jgi:hypothetical protein
MIYLDTCFYPTLKDITMTGGYVPEYNKDYPFAA